MAGGATRKSNRRVKPDTQNVKVNYDPLRDFEGGPVEMALHRIFFFIRKNLTAVLAGVGLGVVVLIGAVSYRFYEEKQDTAAREAFDELAGDPRLGADITSTEPGTRLLEEYRQKHTIESAVRRSYLAEIGLYRQAGEHSKEGDAAAKLASEMSMPELKMFFHYQAGVAYEEAESYDKAAEQYANALKQVTSDPYSQALALFGQGRALQKMGKTEEAEKVFNDLWGIEQTEDIQDIRAAAAAFRLSQ